MNVSDFRGHLAKTSFSGSTFDSPTKEDPTSLHYIKKRKEEFPLKLIHQQGQLRENLIKEIQLKGLLPFGMLTIRPDKPLKKHQSQDLALSIDKALENRYNPRHKHHWGSPHLTFYERDKANKRYASFHLHILFSMLPIEGVLDKKTLTYAVKDAVREVTGGVDRLSPNQLHNTKHHAELIEYAIRSPWDWMRNIKDYSSFRYFPKGKSGLWWTLADDEYQWDGFYGWKGLVAYVTKEIITEKQMDQRIDRRTLSSLRNSPVTK